MFQVLFASSDVSGMSEVSSSPSSQKAARACASCQKYKRRCDKTLPSCSLCTRLRRPCDYTNRQSENELKARIQELESLVANHVGTLSPQPQSTSASSTQGTGSLSSCATYPAALRFQKLFLDTDIQTRPDAPPPPSSDMIPAAVLLHLGDHAQSAIVMAQYFQTVHKWMPIISRVRLSSLADAELGGRMRADFALLLLAMKLIQYVPGSSSNAVRDRLYVCAKEFAASLEIAGVYTLLKLQANLLIATYEMGHGIFPAAYISVGCCVTQAMALGIHHREAPQILEQPRTWIDWEERQRVWWLVVILERYITSVGDNRPLLSADPKTTSHLPVNDDAWDSGQAMYPERLILSSSKHLSASPFARLAQASHLQGEVIKHCNDGTQSLSHVQNDVEVLNQVIWSFLDVIGKDRSSMMHFYSAVGVCLSALMKLCDHHSCDSFAIYNDRALDVAEMALAREIALRCQAIMKDCIAKAMAFVEVLGEMVQDQESIENLASLSPWFLDSIYQCLANLVYLTATSASADASGYTSQVSLCLELLRKVNRRWNVAGAYLEAIELVEQELKVSHY
ncbi:fungal-specific transcription factor domain-containing protein [Trichoderma longibrachiatum ATCC 18648]|uniref:Fungal-specific transcription factor domain-containing protein n=1 Tax=Trichoderma longibrachiatum ATCC 18648 TaxID=983965 RepID=A0A2T4CBH1_TRILO|nr:fungal-specific transcription factor domain-containing protein [Trichoderma longibrachiatum ATCC 18648]